MKQVIRWASLVAVVLGLGLAQQPASAFMLYGTTGAGNNPSSLYTIDPTTGLSTLVGAVGFMEVVSIDFDPISGVLYGIANSNFAGASRLITINTTTGAGTLVAALSPSIQSSDMSFSPSGILYSWSKSTDDLDRINITTGATTIVGPSGIFTYQNGLDVNSAGTIYMKDGDGNVYTVDPTTGALTFVIDVDPGTGSRFDNVLAFDPTDKLYTVDRSGGNSYLYTLDLTLGTSTLIGATGLSGLGALAFVPEATPPGVPEPSTLLLLGVGGLAIWRAHRRMQR